MFVSGWHSGVCRAVSCCNAWDGSWFRMRHFVQRAPCAGCLPAWHVANGSSSPRALSAAHLVDLQSRSSCLLYWQGLAAHHTMCCQQWVCLGRQARSFASSLQLCSNNSSSNIGGRDTAGCLTPLELCMTGLQGTPCRRAWPT